MKRFSLLLLISIFSCIQVGFSQIKLIGMSPRLSTDTVDVVEWSPLGTGTLARYPAPIFGWTNNTGCFDAYNGHYYLSAVTSGVNSLMTFQSVSNQVSFSPGGQISNATEIDMSNGKIYSILDTAGDLDVYEFNPVSGLSTLIGTIAEPGYQEVRANSTAYDSDNGILYYFGQDSGSNYLYTLRLRAQPFSWTKIPLVTVFNPLTQSPNPYFCANYDQIQDILYCVTPEYDSTFTNISWKIVETNVTTGVLTTRGNLTTFPYLIDLGSSVYDQNSGTLIITGPDNLISGGQRVVFFNTATNTYSVDSMPTPLYEIVCDNHVFAQTRYGAAASNRDVSLSRLGFFPNPANRVIHLRPTDFENPIEITIQSLNGQRVLNRLLRPMDGLSVDLEQIPAGVYMLQLRQGVQTSQHRLLVR